MFLTFHRACGVGALLAACVCSRAQELSVPGLATSVVASTVPANGDVNPYGAAVVPNSFGALNAGDILVSNFNNSANLQGTGTTIVAITPGGTQTLFAAVNPASTNCTGGVGLTTALAVLPAGWVVVGSLPTTDGMSDTAAAGCLLILDGWGNVAETITGWGVNGPWDMAALQIGSRAFLFVTNVLNGTVAGGGTIINEGTVIRIELALFGGSAPEVISSTVIASELAERTDPAALVIGPTGVALDPHGTLYFADSLNNRIGMIPNAVTRPTSVATGATLFAGGALNDPLGLTISGHGEILATNGNNGFLVGTTPAGKPAGKILLDDNGIPPGNGALFGLALGANGLYYVDDATNTLNVVK